MTNGIFTSALGMLPRIKKQELTARNIANVSMTGFKRSKVEFQNVLYRNYKRAGRASKVGAEVPTGLAIGYGTENSRKCRVSRPSLADSELDLRGSPSSISTVFAGSLPPEWPFNRAWPGTMSKSRIRGRGKVILARVVDGAAVAVGP